MAGHGFLRFSCAEPNERLREALEFLPIALAREERVQRYLDENPRFRLAAAYPV